MDIITLKEFMNILCFFFIALPLVYSVINFLLFDEPYDKKYKKILDILCIILPIFAILYSLLK